jgi:hypothetical protein
VVHSAGTIHDALIALRTPVTASAVVDVEAKGALVLGRVLANDPTDLFVLFSSVSSIIGLPGQVDYTAANAFLDAYAAKVNRSGTTRAVVINWNAWQEVGIAVEAARVERDQAPVFPLEAVADPTKLFDARPGAGHEPFEPGGDRVATHADPDGSELTTQTAIRTCTVPSGRADMGGRHEPADPCGGYSGGVCGWPRADGCARHRAAGGRRQPASKARSGTRSEFRGLQAAVHGARAARLA